MAGFILCRTKYASKPYCISNVAINIYSLEELCYYIYNNIYLVGADIIEPGLIKYINNELGEKELAAELEFLMEQNAGLSEIVMTLLRNTDFYSDEEIVALKKVIDQLDTQNVQERLKSRADNFLANKRYRSAIRNYELVVFARRDDSLSDYFYGTAWHNMGVAYAGMYAFRKAAECFIKAANLSGEQESYRSYTAALCMAGNGRGSYEENELMYATRRELENLMDHVSEDIQYMPIKEVKRLRAEGRVTEAKRLLDDIIDGWRNDYCNYMK